MDVVIRSFTCMNCLLRFASPDAGCIAPCTATWSERPSHEIGMHLLTRYASLDGFSALPLYGRDSSQSAGSRMGQQYMSSSVSARYSIRLTSLRIASLSFAQGQGGKAS